MGRGIIFGAIWGVLLAVVTLATVSLYAPLPDPGPVEPVPTIQRDLTETAPEADPGAAPAPEAEVAPPPTTESAAEPAPAEAAAAPDPAAATPPADDPAAEETPAPETASADRSVADDIPLPAGSEFNRPPAEEAAALPQADTPLAAAAPTEVPSPAADQLTTAPRPDTSSAPQPETASDLAQPDLALPDEESGAPIVTNTDLDPLAPPPELQPAPLGLPQIETDPGQLATAPATPPAAPEAAPEAAPGTATPQPAPEAPEVAEAPAPTDTPSLETPTEDRPTAEAAPEPDPVTEAPEASAGLQLPRIGDPVALPEPAETSEPEEGAAPDETPEPLPAIEAFAAAFDPGETRPLMAIILIDDPAFGFDREVLRSFPFPVSFAIDPTRPDAAENAAAYRAAGFEVLMTADLLPEGAVASDVEVALAGARQVLPEAVALIDTRDGRVQGDRPVLDAVVEALRDTGHGLVAYPRGLNAAEQSARRVGVPAATLFREIDDDRERATVITRYLDRAAFAARQDGAVIVIGHTYSDTVTAMFSWALGTRSESVALAPISAILTR